jgi:hypoxanthine phosphoribosyltransferase
MLRRLFSVFALGAYYKIEVINALTKEAGGAESKDMDDPEERKTLLEKSMKLAKKHDFSGKKVLLLDDLFQSGATLMAATKILYEQANAEVCSGSEILDTEETKLRRYTVSKRRDHEHDYSSQFYAGIQSAGGLRGVNGSQERQ